MYFQKELETMRRADIEALQLERLKHAVKYCYDNVPFYTKKLDEAKVTADKIRTLQDIQYIPFTTKDDLKNNYPFGLFARPKKEIVRIHGSSGTSGKPIIVGYTRNDMNLWSDLIARFATAVGVTDEDIVQIAFGYGLFTGGFGLHQGMEKIGAMVIPLSSGNTDRQLMIMQDFQSTALVATPSYALYLAELIKQRELQDKIALRVGLFGGEGCTVEMREQIEKNMGIMATDNYGLSELIGPGVAGECQYREGMHLAEDHFIPEIINSDTGEVLPAGETGELVITSLTKEAFPILRYRTRDISRLNYEPCKCGRTHVRMDKIKGRADDMLIIKGVNVFPSQIESVIVGMEDVGPHYMLIVKKEGLLDALEVEVELSQASNPENYQHLEQVRTHLQNKLHSLLGLRAKVRLVEPNTIERFQGKAKRVIDKRNEK